MRMKEATDIVDIINELEGGELIIEDFDDLEGLKNLCRDFSRSQGFYGRLLASIEEADIQEKDFPITF